MARMCCRITFLMLLLRECQCFTLLLQVLRLKWHFQATALSLASIAMASTEVASQATWKKEGGIVETATIKDEGMQAAEAALLDEAAAAAMLSKAIDEATGPSAAPKFAAQDAGAADKNKKEAIEQSDSSSSDSSASYDGSVSDDKDSRSEVTRRRAGPALDPSKSAEAAVSPTAPIPPVMIPPPCLPPGLPPAPIADQRPMEVDLEGDRAQKSVRIQWHGFSRRAVDLAGLVRTRPLGRPARLRHRHSCLPARKRCKHGWRSLPSLPK